MEYEELDDLKYIKKHFGEKLSHLCRELFSSILERPGLLYHLLITNFNPSRDLYYDIAKEGKEQNFKNYIYSFTDIYDEKATTDKSVKELLESVGYNLYECKTNEDIQKFKKYYRGNETLCTFKDPNRIKGHYIFFIVKKNVDEIKRENFDHPQREDEYGVSVLDLQFDKGEKQIVSIKCRYNHTVSNPDATYSNNLDKIVPGLTYAFEKEYDFNIGKEYLTDFALNHYVRTIGGRLYKYNYEINNIHYCPDNVIINNGIVINNFKDKGRYTLLDCFILDEKRKIIYLYDQRISSSFIDDLENIKDVKILKKGDNREITLYFIDKNPVIIKIDKNNQIIGLYNDNVIYVGECYLSENITIKELDLPNLKCCGDHFLAKNTSLKELNLPNLKVCGIDFLKNNNVLEELSLPSLKKCGNQFLCYATLIDELRLPNLEECGNHFLRKIHNLQTLDLPKLKVCGNSFLINLNKESIYLPSLIRCGNDFVGYNKSLIELNLPNLEECGVEFLNANNSLVKLELPNLIRCNNNFLGYNRVLKELNLPKLVKCGDWFLYSNRELKELSLPSLERAGYCFLAENVDLEKVNLPKLRYCDGCFLYSNNKLTNISLPSLEACDENFLLNNNKLESIDLPNLKEVGFYFLGNNTSLEDINLPNLNEYKYGFLVKNQRLSRRTKRRMKSRG